MSLRVHELGDAWVLDGEVSAENAVELRETWAALGLRAGQARFELLDLELEDGVAVVEAVNAVRQLLALHGRVVLVNTPQMLAHTLYKVGDLDMRSIELVSPREDEGFGAG